MYKLTKHLLPPLFENMFIKTSDVHNHSTRQADLLYVQFAVTKRTQRTLKHYGIKLWNSLYHVVHPDCAIGSFRLSVCPSVTPFWVCSHHHIIMKFSGVITNDRIDVHAKGQGQRSNVKDTVVDTQISCFWTVTPIWIHIWWWNDAQSLMLLRRGALLFVKVIRQISRSHG